jgi:hypothetical protein
VVVTYAVVWGVLGSQSKDGGFVSLFQTAPKFESSWEQHAHDELLPQAQNSERPGQIVLAALVAMWIAASAEGLARKSKRGRLIGVGTALAGLVVGFGCLYDCAVAGGGRWDDSEFIEKQSDQMHTCPTYPIRCDDR